MFHRNGCTQGQTLSEKILLDEQNCSRWPPTTQKAIESHKEAIACIKIESQFAKGQTVEEPNCQYSHC